MVCEDGLPSRTDFWVLGKSEVDFTKEVAPSELVPDISSLETRWGLSETHCFSIFAEVGMNYVHGNG